MDTKFKDHVTIKQHHAPSQWAASHSNQVFVILPLVCPVEDPSEA